MGTTVRDIAKVARVSIGTVSRALKNQPGLSETTRRRVLSVATQMGYDHSNLRRSRIRRMTLVAAREHGNFASATFVAQLHESVERVGRGMGIATSTLAFDPTEDLLDQLRRHAPDALAIAGLIEPAHLQKLAMLNRPMVLVDLWAPNFRCVNLDNALGAHLAMTHLFARGCRRIAFIGGSPAHYGIAQRALGFRRAYFEAGMPFDPALEVTIAPGVDAQVGATAAMERLLELASPPDAVFAFNDVAALAALRVCERRGVAVPGEMAIVGFEDGEAAREASLTTIGVDKARLGEMAVDLLLDTDLSPRNVIEPVTLTVRESTLALEHEHRSGT
ncbi:LacI family DNA-binding transcriptional regulator [Pararobbsia alpina]|uniref:HTH-type transcriptional regulator DegA n=1 Tax=Pararobbsia alpina TaxID=621374 RepID=A0A6S7BS45_9BURK|nr:LacI family DNA-binding transcriptional regulator [Pararobbsia alpina]CAB3793345.1 HTH-type transcriptional regulator DegA [Pararobbsia alpina]